MHTQTGVRVLHGVKHSVADDPVKRIRSHEERLADKRAENPAFGFYSVADWMKTPEYQALAAAAVAKDEQAARDRAREAKQRRSWRRTHGLPLNPLEFCRVVFQVPSMLALPASIKARSKAPRRPGSAAPARAVHAEHLRPQWLIRAESVVRVTPKGFGVLRGEILCLSVAGCAAFLRVPVEKVERWEDGRARIPFAAFHLLSVIAHQGQGLDRFEEWDGWYVVPSGPDAGKLRDPRSTECFSAAEVGSLPRLWGQLLRLGSRVEELNAALSEAEAENTRLRKLFQTMAVTDELRTMHDRLSVLLSRIGTADVIEFPPSMRGHEPKEASR